MLFVTVEHSGTMATIEMMGWRMCPIEEAKEANGRVLFAHLYPRHMPAIREAMQRMPTVTTYRPEIDIAGSWETRGKPVSELVEQLANWREVVSAGAHVLHLGKRWP